MTLDDLNACVGEDANSFDIVAGTELSDGDTISEVEVHWSDREIWLL